MTETSKNRYYKGDESEKIFEGVQTNIAPTKYVIELLRNNGESLNKIIMLCSKEVREQKLNSFDGMTSCEIYINHIRQFADDNSISLPDDVFEIVEYDLLESEDVNKILTPLSKIVEVAFNNEENIVRKMYIDFTGGTRNSSLAIIFSARILQEQGINMGKILYANLSKANGETIAKHADIEECTRIYDTFDYYESVCKNKATGKNDGFERYMKKYGEKAVNIVLESAEKLDLQKSAGQDYRAEETKAKEDDNYLTRGMIEAINSNTKKSDVIGRVHEYVTQNDSKVFNYFEENIYQMFLENHIIKNNNLNSYEIEWVKNEFFANYQYYCASHWRSYIDFVRELIDVLYDNIDKSPKTIAENMLKEAKDLSNYTYETQFHSRVRISEYTEKEFNIVYKDDIEKRKQSMLGDISSSIQNNPTLNPDVILKIINKYNADNQKFIRIFYSVGFPCGNMYKNRVYMYYASKYEKLFYESVTELNKLFYNNKGQKPRTDNILSHLSENNISYQDLITLLKNDDKMLYIMFPMNCEIRNIEYHKYKSQNQIQGFYTEFMYMSDKIKKLRNRLTHGKNVEAEEIKDGFKILNQTIDFISNYN